MSRAVAKNTRRKRLPSLLASIGETGKKAAAFDAILGEHAMRKEWAEAGHDTSAEFGRRVTAIVMKFTKESA